jgi:hypothetical protein
MLPSIRVEQYLIQSFTSMEFGCNAGFGPMPQMSLLAWCQWLQDTTLWTLIPKEKMAVGGWSGGKR